MTVLLAGARVIPLMFLGVLNFDVMAYVHISSSAEGCIGRVSLLAEGRREGMNCKEWSHRDLGIVRGRRVEH